MEDTEKGKRFAEMSDCPCVITENVVRLTLSHIKVDKLANFALVKLVPWKRMLRFKLDYRAS